MITSDRLFSQREAADRMGVHERTIERWRLKERRLPFRTLPGGRVRILQSDLDQLLREPGR